LLSEKVLAKRLAELNELFAAEFLPISAETGTGIELLRDTIDRKIIELAFRSSPSIEHQVSSIENRVSRIESRVALTARHRQAVTDAIENVGESINELKAGNDEVTAMMLRAAYQAISDIESAGRIDDEILERIFSHFCIGK